VTGVVETHTHAWIDLGGGMSGCAVNGCPTLHHEHQYTLHAHAAHRELTQARVFVRGRR
jgi:hypothetical protein